MKSLKIIAAYTVIAYLCLVGGEGLFFLYTSLSIPGRDSVQLRYRQDEEIKKAFLKSNPEYSGYFPLKIFKGNGLAAKLVRKHSFLPLGHGLPNSRLIYCNEGYGFLKYTTDGYGFHNDDAVWEAERPWLLIGDSFAHGACVPTEHNIARQLMVSSGESVINLGTGGNGPDIYAALARVFIGRTRPQKVVLMFCDNDFNAPNESIYNSQTALFAPYHRAGFREETEAFYKDMRKFADAERSRFIAADKGLLKKVETPSERILRVSKRVLGLTEIRKTISGGGETYNYVQLAIETTVQECAKWDPGCDIYVVYIPPSQYFRPRPKRMIEAQVSFLRKVLAGVEKPITLVDLSNSLGRSSYAPLGPHLSIEGYRLLASRILARAD